MGELPTIALLESTHAFPGPYLFKVIGRNEKGFVARTVAAVRDELGDAIVVQTAREVLAVYRRLSKIAGLVMLF